MVHKTSERREESRLTFTPEVGGRPFDGVRGLNTSDEVGGPRLPLVARFALVAVSGADLQALARRALGQIHSWNVRARTSDVI